MIENKALIEKLIQFKPNTFYFFEIIARRKDVGNELLAKGEKKIRHFYVETQEQFDELYPKMVEMCNANNARLYMRVNRRCMASITKAFAKRVLNLMVDGVIIPSAYERAYTSVVGKTPDRRSDDYYRKFIVDIDGDDYSVVEQLLELIKLEGDDIATHVIPTLNGWHIVARAFNTSRLKKTIDIDKDGCTLVYFNPINDKDNELITDRIMKIIELRCKETAKNVRHKAADLIIDNINMPDLLHRKVMNIQFEDIKPKDL